MVHIMVTCVVRSDVLQGVPGKSVAAVVIDGLDGATGEEDHALACRQAGGFEGDTGAKRIEKETFKRVIVKSTKGVGHVKTVMAGVKGRYGN